MFSSLSLLLQFPFLPLFLFFHPRVSSVLWHQCSSFDKRYSQQACQLYNEKHCLLSAGHGVAGGDGLRLCLKVNFLQQVWVCFLGVAAGFLTDMLGSPALPSTLIQNSFLRVSILAHSSKGVACRVISWSFCSQILSWPWEQGGEALVGRNCFCNFSS